MAAILIVDDEKNIRDHLATYVGSLGHMVDTAADAQAALAKLNQANFDIVLTDVRMAGMNGLTLLREIRRQQPQVSVVLMTAYATVPQAIEAMRAGAFEYLMKPFAPDDVRLLINHLVDLQARRRANAAPARPSGAAGAVDDVPAINPGSTEPDLSLKDLERRRIEHVLAEAPTFEDAARRLGIDPATLWRKRKRWGLGNAPKSRRVAGDGLATGRSGAKK